MTRYRVFIREADVTPPPPPPPPGFRPFFGSSSSSPTDWDNKQGLYSPAITRYFFQVGANLDWNDSTLAHIRSNTTSEPLYISWKEPFVQADVDAFLSHAKTDTARLYFLTFHHEPENDATITPAQYCTNNATVRKRWVAAGKPSNIKIASTLQGFTYHTSQRNPADYYVDTVTADDGNDYKVFDILCADQYDTGYKNGVYLDLVNYLKPLQTFAKARNLPVGFGEFASPVGPLRTTNLTARRSEITTFADWAVANAGTGSGQVWIVCYWDSEANANWKPANSQYSTYGPITTTDYRIALTPVLKAQSPGSKAGQTAYSEADPITAAAWQGYCQDSRAYHGTD